jgi:hypothetical protein
VAGAIESFRYLRAQPSTAEDDDSHCRLRSRGTEPPVRDG